MAIVKTESEKTRSWKYVKKTAAQLKIKCRIEEFQTLMNTTKPEEEILWSEGVSSELAPRAVWMLEVYPNGMCKDDKGTIGVFLRLSGPMSDDGEALEAAYHLYLLDETTGRIDSIDSGTHKFGEDKGYGWGEDKISHGRVKRALHADGSLVVVADIDFLPPDDDSALHVDLQQWPAKFTELHGDEASSDCTIEIGGMAIPAHKSILAAQSPIFRSMFTHQEAEEFQSSVVKITDFNDLEPMRAVVRYCYQGFLDAATMDEDGTVEIFKLADRYCIAGLKALLEKHFVDKRLDVENVVAVAVLADTYTAPKLMEACIKLIAKEGDTIFESADWKELEKRDSKLTTQLAIAAYRRM